MTTPPVPPEPGKRTARAVLNPDGAPVFRAYLDGRLIAEWPIAPETVEIVCEWLIAGYAVG